MKKYICTFLSALLMVYMLSVPVNAYYGTFNYFRESPEGEHYGLYKCDNAMYLYEDDGKTYEAYTGWTKTKDGGRRYYVRGDVCKGWRKINDKWYYFDLSTGKVASGEAVIAGGRYYFNDDCSWNGKLSKRSRYPEDFFITFTASGMDGYTEYSIDAEKKTLTAASVSYDEDMEKKYKEYNISSKDIQAFYSMMLSSRMTEIKAKVVGYNIENNYLLTGSVPLPDGTNPEDEDYWWTEPVEYKFEITYNGNNYEVYGDDSSTLFLYSDEIASNFCHMIWTFLDYYNNL